MVLVIRLRWYTLIYCICCIYIEYPQDPKSQIHTSSKPNQSPFRTWPNRQIPATLRSRRDRGARRQRWVPWHQPWRQQRRGQSPAAGRKCCNKWHQRWLWLVDVIVDDVDLDGREDFFHTFSINVLFQYFSFRLCFWKGEDLGCHQVCSWSCLRRIRLLYFKQLDQVDRWCQQTDINSQQAQCHARYARKVHEAAPFQ